MVQPYVDRHQVTFPVAVDEADLFGRTFGLKAIPVSFLVDEVGIIRLRGGGPSRKFLSQVEAILEEPITDLRGSTPQLPGLRPTAELAQAAKEHAGDGRARLALAEAYAGAGRWEAAEAEFKAASSLEPSSADILFAWGQALLAQGMREAALRRMKAARDLEPENWRIRKQIWAMEHPDKFYAGESPDYTWQKEQLEREKKRGI